MAFLDHMLLAQPRQSHHPEQRHVAHDLLAQRYSVRRPAPLSTPPPEWRREASALGDCPSASKMATPHRHLPPPAPLSYQDPGLQQLAAGGQQRLPLSAGMPAPPPQTPGAEDAMRHWLGTKAEEEKRRQEEEKTRQESLRLEQKKIEQSMLLELMRNQVPFNLIPMIFWSLGNASSANSNAELLQQSISQMIGQHFATPSAVEGNRDQSAHQVQSMPATPLDGSYGALLARPGVISGPPSSQRSNFPTGQFKHRLPDAGSALASSQSVRAEEQVPILFHHWQPPESAVAAQTAATSADYANSPKKRKAVGPHQPVPAPLAGPRYQEPAPVRRAHTRHRSDASSRSILHPQEDKPHGRRRADTAMTEDSSTSQSQWQNPRFQTSPSTKPASRQAQGSSISEESASFAAEHRIETRSSYHGRQMGSASTRGNHAAEQRASRYGNDEARLAR